MVLCAAYFRPGALSLQHGGRLVRRRVLLQKHVEWPPEPYLQSAKRRRKIGRGGPDDFVSIEPRRSRKNEIQRCGNLRKTRNGARGVTDVRGSGGPRHSLGAVGESFDVERRSSRSTPRGTHFADRHQYFAAMHHDVDTDRYHAHLAINKISLDGRVLDR